MKTPRETTSNTEMSTAVLAEEIPTKCQFISQISFEHLYVQTHMYRSMCVVHVHTSSTMCSIHVYKQNTKQYTSGQA